MENTEKTLICPVCSWRFKNGAYAKKKYPAADNNSEVLNKPASILFCANCGLGLAFPMLTESEIDSFYTDGDYWKTSKAGKIYPIKFPVHYALAWTRWNFIKALIRREEGGRRISILDIGPGHGFFGMVAAKDRSVFLEKYCVIEKDSAMKESLKMTWPVLFPAVRFEAEDRPESVRDKYDFVILSHVLEHLNKPFLMLEEALRTLAEDGYLLVDVPNQDHSFKQDVFPHMFFFNRSCLKSALEKAGLEVKYIGCYGRDMNKSPINHLNRNNLGVKLGMLLYRSRCFIPTAVSRPFFIWYFGASTPCDNGTWIRALARKIRSDI